MMTLVRESNEVASLLEDAVTELSRERADGEEISFVNEVGCRRAKITGSTSAERKRSALAAHAYEVGEFLFAPDGSETFGAIDRASVLRLLEDPLSPPTRMARRNLLLTAALLFLMGAAREWPGKVPGFEFNLKNHPWVVVVFTLAVLGYQLVSFLLYARVDAARRAVAESELHDEAKTLRLNVSKASEALATLGRSEFGGRVVDAMGNWVAYAEGELRRLEHELSAAQRRRQWDLWLPLPLVVGALAVFACWLLKCSNGAP